ncbi:MAG: hypothetical protein AABX01_00910 [Candidatus Micrarchaeota archaeon]|mgnify:CR=1 FL=1
MVTKKEALLTLRAKLLLAIANHPDLKYHLVSAELKGGLISERRLHLILSAQSPNVNYPEKFDPDWRKKLDSWVARQLGVRMKIEESPKNEKPMEDHLRAVLHTVSSHINWEGERLPVGMRELPKVNGFGGSTYRQFEIVAKFPRH